MKVKTQLIIVAGGLGTRLGSPQPKALAPLAASPILIHTLNAFQAIDLHDQTVIVHPKDHESKFKEALHAEFPSSNIRMVLGGEERYDSVTRGLKYLSTDTELVLIHDAARPFIQEKTIHNVMNAALECGAATVATPCKDTILQTKENHLLDTTPDRATLWACQTPQAFRREIIEKAYASPPPSSITDDATLVHQSGVPVRIVEGSDTNLKITTPNDLQYAEFLLAKGLV